MQSPLTHLFSQVTRYTALVRSVCFLGSDTDELSHYRDFKINFKNEVIVANECIFTTTGLLQKIDYFKLGKLTQSEGGY